MSPESGPAGNVYDKYSTRHPVERMLVNRFLASVDRAIDTVEQSGITDVLDVGCGEGMLSSRMARFGPSVLTTAFDIDVGCVRQARETGDQCHFCVADACEMPFGTDEFDLVVALEVLEHLDQPQAALLEMRRVSRSYMLISVPDEPAWRCLNYLRGAYRDAWGNTPGHVQHWGYRAFRSLLERHTTVRAMWRPFPWLMALCDCSRPAVA